MLQLHIDTFPALFDLGYTTDILLDALTYSEHAGKGGKLDVEDVSLAVQAKVNWSFKEGGERDVSNILSRPLSL